MNRDRRWHVDTIYQAARDRASEARAAFLAEACAGDEELRREVESRLASHPPGDSLVGRRLGTYQVLAPLGVGGMGEVYRARDTRLGREVALKVLPPAFTADPDRLARFEREARVLAALNHSHIAAIYGVQDIEPAAGAEPAQALVLELVEGDTLAERISKSAGRRRSAGLAIDEALTIARQMADALDAAHEKGIVHRDLKPANIKVTPEGVVKVLDFGLAKLAPGTGVVDGGTTSSPTITAEATREGVLAGTAAYMSPEQARGETVDKRTDVWAFGCVLYEMLTGRAAFARETIADTLAAILEREPDWSALPAETPTALRRLLTHCLRKDPRHRVRDIGDVRLALEELATAPGVSHTTVDPVRPRRAVAVGVAVLTLGLLAAASLLILGRQPDSERGHASLRVVRFNLSLDGLDAGLPRPSPDGRLLVFVRATQQDGGLLWIHSLDSGESRSLAGTEGGVRPIWSPDGRWVAFYADGRLKKVSPSGGPPQTIAPLRGFQDAAWGAQGDIIFRPSNREALFRIRDSGGPPAPLTTLDRSLTENSHRGPVFLPDGRRFLYTNRCEHREHNALFIGAIDSDRVRRVMPLHSNTAYVPPRSGSVGALLYYRDGGLFAQRFDTESEALVGEPLPVLDRVGYTAVSVAAQFEASLDGSLIVSRRTSADDHLPVWFDRAGEPIGTAGPVGSYFQPRISADGKRLAFTRGDSDTGNRDVWYTELDRGITAPLTTHGANDWFAVWSPDGKQLIFTSDRGGSAPGEAGYLFIKRSMDPGRDETHITDTDDGGVYDWTRDGRWISFGGRDLWVASSSGNPAPFPFLATSFNEGGGRFSPDGRWIAYTSDESGRPEIYVRQFTGGPAATDEKVRVSINGGEHPAWRADGRELFYLSGTVNDLRVNAADTSGLDRSGTIGIPVQLFRACPETAAATSLGGRPWDRMYDTVDGKRFLINCRAQRQDSVDVLLNWTMPPS